MHEFFPLLILGAAIGVLSLIFLVVYLVDLKKGERDAELERHMPDSQIIRRLIEYAKPYRGQFVLVFFISARAMEMRCF